jgi:hypothetical protein
VCRRQNVDQTRILQCGCVHCCLVTLGDDVISTTCGPYKIGRREFDNSIDECLFVLTRQLNG